MKGYDKEFENNISKKNIIITIIFSAVFLIAFFALIATVNKGVDSINSRFDTAIEKYTAKGYVICDVKVKLLNQYSNVAVDKNEIDSYKKKESFMMSLHALSTDNVYIVSTDDITGITIHAEKEGADNE